jgi:hypothetical protein
MGLKRHKIGTSQILNTSDRKGLDYKECGRFVDNLSMDIKAVTCSRCVVKMIAPPEYKEKPQEKRPRGWQLKKEYIAPDGTKYIRGRRQDADVKNNSDDSDGVKRKNK